MIKIIIADDHAIVRKGLNQIISEQKDMKVVAEAENGSEALDKALSYDCDILVLDISMPDKNGLDVLKELKSKKPSLSVLILSMHPEEQYAKRVLTAGASGYLTKDTAPEELIIALRKIYQGGTYIGASLGEKLAMDLNRDLNKQPHETLSDREYQVMCMIASGKTVSEIAREIFVSVKTVSTYRMRLMRKMNLENNAQLTSYAVKAGLV